MNLNFLLLLNTGVFLKVAGTPLQLENQACSLTGSLAPNSADCGSYLICNHKTFFAQRCAPGLHWDNNIKACNFIQLAGCESGMAELDRQGSARPPDFGRLSQSGGEDPDAKIKARASLERCLNKNMMPLFGSDTLHGFPPLGSERCYPLFEQGPCGDGHWFVLDSDKTFLPKAHCKKKPNCDVYVLETEYEGPECIPCELPVFENGVLIACNHNQGEIISDFIGGTGLNVCDNGFHKDTRGECKRVYQFSNSLEPVYVEPRKIQEPKRNLRKYLQSINRLK